MTDAVHSEIWLLFPCVKLHWLKLKLVEKIQFAARLPAYKLYLRNSVILCTVASQILSSSTLRITEKCLVYILLVFSSWLGLQTTVITSAGCADWFSGGLACVISHKGPYSFWGGQNWSLNSHEWHSAYKWPSPSSNICTDRSALPNSKLPGHCYART